MSITDLKTERTKLGLAENGKSIRERAEEDPPELDENGELLPLSTVVRFPWPS